MSGPIVLEWREQALSRFEKRPAETRVGDLLEIQTRPCVQRSQAGLKLIVEPLASQDPWNELLHPGGPRSRLLCSGNLVDVAPLAAGR